ncbi:hypothetical protein EGT67_16000 [Prescottella agglutinans]|uniref:Tetratricopeptide repeat protein n=2 Tax=Prescottella agglutinans TaxID=1644129 RepID=A0A3S3CY08_9NOCA|nr:hypothetical protein [Prescottella agglutinans]RVW08427.1 hypothetical protein EGT67_16000 [Prescottella agglutinans]
MTDEIMDAITRAVVLGREGDVGAARSALVDLWAAIGPAGDALHRCTLAHYLADLYDDPAQALVWDVRALDAADALTDDRVQQHHTSLAVRGFYPSLHLNLADNFRRLGSFDQAQVHLDAAGRYLDALGDDEYGAMIRTAVDEVGAAVAARSVESRPSHP